MGTHRDRGWTLRIDVSKSSVGVTILDDMLGGWYSACLVIYKV